MALSIRGTCQFCNRRRRVRRDGLLRLHYEKEWEYSDGRGAVCPGSGKVPKETVGDEAGWFCNVGCSGCDDAIKYGI